MLFNSYIFICVFLPITYLVYLFILKQSRNYKFALIWLFLTSLFFYGWWEVRYLAVILGSIVFNYLVSKAIVAKKEKSSSKALLTFGILGNLGVLFYFKYANFFVETISHFFDNSFVFEKLVLPLGISFYTFQQISYLLDIQKGVVKDDDFLSYGLFITFFPQLIAGPIVHHKEMLPQFSNKRDDVDISDDLQVGLTLFIMGLFKKVAIADVVARYSTPVFLSMARGEDISIVEAWSSAVAFSFQVYFDFSGYSDMALGIARMFGIRLPQNFHSPYKSIGGIEFWRRWHMTLGRFINLVIYAPLFMPLQRFCRRNKITGLGNFLITEMTPLMLTFLAAGIWHGAGWNFIVYGIAHGIWVSTNQGWLKFKKAKLKKRSRKPSHFFVHHGLVFFSFIIATVIFIYFKSYNLEIANKHILKLINLSSFSWGALDKKAWAFFCLLYIVVVFFPNSQEVMAKSTPTISFKLKKNHGISSFWFWKPNLVWALILSCLFVLSFMGLNSVSEFIYFNF